MSEYRIVIKQVISGVEFKIEHERESERFLGDISDFLRGDVDRLTIEVGGSITYIDKRHGPIRLEYKEV